MTDDTPANGSVTNTNPSSNPNSPFYIHPTDYPRQIHVNENLCNKRLSPLLIIHNKYMTKLPGVMKDFLLAKNRANFIDGTVKKSTQEPINIELGDKVMLWLEDDLLQPWKRIYETTCNTPHQQRRSGMALKKDLERKVHRMLMNWNMN